MTLVFAVVAAFSSFMVYGRLVALLSTEDIQDFCSGLPGFIAERKRLREQNGNLQKEIPGFGPSLMAWFLEAPAMFLNIALVGYLVGLGLFWLLGWVESANADDFSGVKGRRNVSCPSTN
jgi:hypothetical protein